jgi:hypothetical protein
LPSFRSFLPSKNFSKTIHNFKHSLYAFPQQHDINATPHHTAQDTFSKSTTMCTPTISREEFLSTYITPTTSPSSEPECPICKEEYDDITHAAVTFSHEGSCGHVFGQHCIETWLGGDMINTCCLCRRTLFTLAPEEHWEDEDDFDSDEEDEEEDEEDEISALLEARFSTLLEYMWESIWLRISLPVPARGLTGLFLMRFSMDACGGLVDVQSRLRDDQLERFDRLFEEMRSMQRMFVAMTREGENQEVPPFPEEKRMPWIGSVKHILQIEAQNQHLAGLFINLTDAVVTQIVEGTWLSVELAIAAQQSTGDMSLVEALPGHALGRVLYYAGTYVRKPIEFYLNDRRWATLCEMLEEMRFLQQGLNLEVLPEGRERAWREEMRWIFMIGELEEQEFWDTDDEDETELDSVAGWEAECEEIEDKYEVA